ncbi:hypothetical protein BDW42DRAFT_157949, partial [Aspergillus taichungensis]
MTPQCLDVCFDFPLFPLFFFLLASLFLLFFLTHGVPRWYSVHRFESPASTSKSASKLRSNRSNTQISSSLPTVPTMSGIVSVQQPDRADEAMDVSMQDYSPDASQGLQDQPGDPMDISPIVAPRLSRSSESALRLHSPPSDAPLHSLASYGPRNKNKAGEPGPLCVRTDGKPMPPTTRSTFLKPSQRFSPRSARIKAASSIPATMLKSKQAPTFANTGSRRWNPSGFNLDSLPSNYHLPSNTSLNPFSNNGKPISLTQNRATGVGLANNGPHLHSFQALSGAATGALEPTTRDSSFNSLLSNPFSDQTHSFESTTSAASVTPRKRSIDPETTEDPKLVDASESTLPTPPSVTKYRRVGLDSFPLSATANENQAAAAATTEPSQSHLSARAAHTQPIAAGTAQAPMQATTMQTSAVHARAFHTAAVPQYHIPGHFPEAASTGPEETSEPLMSGALPVPTPDIDLRAETDASMRDPDTHNPANPIGGGPWMALQGYVDHLRTLNHELFKVMGNTARTACAYLGFAGTFAQEAYQRLRRRPVRAASPNRTNVRALPEEQRRRILDRQWHIDRGRAAPQELPFPTLNLDVPRYGVAPSPVRTAPSSASLPPPRKSALKTSTHASRHNRTANRSPGQDILRQTMRSSINKKVRMGPRARSHGAPGVTPDVGRSMRHRPEVREHARRVRILQEQIRSGKYDAKEILGIKSERPSQTENPEPLQTPPRHQLVDSPRRQSVEIADATSKPKKVHFASPISTQVSYESILVPDLAPYLHCSPTTLQPEKEDRASVSEEGKENIPPVEPSIEPVQIQPKPIELQEEEEEGPIHDPWEKPVEFPLGRAVSAVSLFYPTPKPLPPGRTDSIYADEWKQMEEEERRKQRPRRIRPEGPAVRPLSAKWNTRVQEAMSGPASRKIATTLSGDPLTKKDLATCFTPMEWLNDEVINAYLGLIVDYLRRTHNNAGRHDKPRYHAFNSFFFTNLREKGYASVRRWGTRAKIGGQSLLEVDTVFVPVHHQHHWTLILVKPSDRTIEHFDSLGALSARHVATVQTWLQGELGDSFVQSEWRVLPSRSPQQDNGSDCGVFLLSTAKAVAVGLEPLSYGAADTPLLRRKIVAELMNGGFEGEFDPSLDGEVL